MLAHEHGYGTDTPIQTYEAEWLYATAVDIVEKPECYALMKDDADEAALDAVIDLLRNFMKKCDA